MRLIGSIEDPQKAQQFSAFLLTEQIENKLDEGQNGENEVWVREEDQFKEALAKFQEFQSAPDAPKYAQAVGQANRIRQEQEKKRRAVEKNMVKVKSSRVGLVAKPVGPMTKAVIAFCVIAAVLTGLGSQESINGGPNRALQFVAIDHPQSQELVIDHSPPYDDLSIRLASIQRGELWRLVTPIFIHYGPMHLIFNILMFLQLARLIESRYGTMWLGLLVVAVAVASNFAQGVVPDRLGGSPPGLFGQILITRFGGLSGVVYGTFGFVWMKSLYDPSSGFRLPDSMVLILIGWLFFCMLPIAPRIFGHGFANWAHGVGLVTGILLALVKR